MEPITKEFFITTLATSFGAFRIEMKDEFDKQRKEFDLKFNFLREDIKEVQRDVSDFKEETNRNFKDLRSEMNENFEEVNDTIKLVGDKVFGDHEDRIAALEHAIN